jgi:phage terminase large subunit-like protein
MTKISDKKLQEAIGFIPSKPQQQILDCTAREMTIAAGRRFGKSAICAYLGLKTLLEPNKKVWIVAPTYDLTNKVFDYLVKWLAKVLPSQRDGISYRPYPRVRLANGSILECRSTENPTGLLGEEVDLEIVDEAARIQRHIYDTYLYPVTSSRQGRIVKISTPFGKNWFYESSLKDKEEGGYFNFQSKDNPTFKPEEWERAKEKLPEQVFKQEYMALFLEDAASVFRNILEVVRPDCLEDAKGDRAYIMGVDLAQINDFTVLTVVDTYTHKVVAWERFKEIDYTLQKARIKALADRYRKARIIIDTTQHQSIADDIRRDGYLVDDFRFSNKSKQHLVEKLMIFIEQKGILIPENETIIDELSAYGYEMSEHGNIKYSAPIGCHDDCVISLALAVWGLDTPMKEEKGYLKVDNNPTKKKSFQYI